MGGNDVGSGHVLGYAHAVEAGDALPLRQHALTLQQHALTLRIPPNQRNNFLFSLGIWLGSPIFIFYSGLPGNRKSKIVHAYADTHADSRPKKRSQPFAANRL